MEKPVLLYLCIKSKLVSIKESIDSHLLLAALWWIGVQRWMYFAKYLKQLGWEPIVITVDENQAAYPRLDQSLAKEVEGIEVIKTTTREPLRLYSRLISGSSSKGLPQAQVNSNHFFQKLAVYIRGNYFIPDARKGWVPFAVKAAQKRLAEDQITHLITTGPPHSTHLAGLQLAEEFKLNWWVDFRDPWTEVFYNKQMRRTKRSQQKRCPIRNKSIAKGQWGDNNHRGNVPSKSKSKSPATAIHRPC